MAIRKHDRQKIVDLADGVRSSREIAELTGYSMKYVQRILLKMNLPRLKQAAPMGEKNPLWKGGHRISRDGYVYVRAPIGHPFAKPAKGKNYGRILQHRLLMEQKLGRYLDPKEVVDHIDGNTLNNDLSNLRLFASNAEHLSRTLKGKTPQWSELGLQNMRRTKEEKRQLQEIPVADKYDRSKKAGAVQLKRMSHGREQLQTIRPDLYDKIQEMETKLAVLETRLEQELKAQSHPSVKGRAQSKPE